MFLITWPGGSWEATLRYGIIIALIFLTAFWIATVFWTYRDIRQRTRDPVLQTAAVILQDPLSRGRVFLKLCGRPNWPR